MIALLMTISMILTIIWWIFLIMIIMSWLINFNVINTRNQFVASVWRVVNQITEPILRPIRRIVPPVGGLDLSPIIVFVIIVMMTTNAVNLTDGLDGLATGASTMVLSSYLLIAFWEYRHWCADIGAPSFSPSYCYQVRDPLEIGLIAGAAAGACLGFLWWNASPARIFMGDTGSMALGGLIAGLSVATRTILLLPILGLLFVIIALSLVIQVISFRTTGKRVFRMSPLHHHFELAGWSEVNIVIRFWIIAGIGVVVGLGLFYGDFLRVTS